MRRPKKGQTGISSHFTKAALALSQGTEWNSSTHIIQARSHQMPVTVSAELDLNQNIDLRMKGFISYYQFPRYLILTPPNSLPNLLLNPWRDSPQLLPMGICFTVRCSWKWSCFLLPLYLFSHSFWVTNYSPRLFCSPTWPNDRSQGSNNRSYSFFPFTAKYLILWSFFLL